MAGAWLCVCVCVCVCVRVCVCACVRVRVVNNIYTTLIKKTVNVKGVLIRLSLVSYVYSRVRVVRTIHSVDACFIIESIC